MGLFQFENETITFIADSACKMIKLPHFFLPNPFEVARFLHEFDKCTFHKALEIIRDCIDDFTEKSCDKLGKRTAFYTTQYGKGVNNSSLQSPFIRVQQSQTMDCDPNLKEIYDGPWSPLSE